jgi:hypothetical protein
VPQEGIQDPKICPSTQPFAGRREYSASQKDVVREVFSAETMPEFGETPDKSPTADSEVVKRLFKKVIFPRFGVPRVVISDGSSHFINRSFDGLLEKYRVNHKLATTYHPQTSGQANFGESCWVCQEILELETK